MKQTFYFILLLCLVAMTSYAQPYGNEWIDYSKTYHRIKLSGPGTDNGQFSTTFFTNQHGITRIDYNTIQSYNLQGFAGAGFQVYYKGKEIPIYVTTPGLFGPGDYIEFYWEENDGEYDNQLYVDPNWQPTPNRSLFTDEARYYLTWDGSASASNKRYTEVANNYANNGQDEAYFIRKNRVTYRNAASSGATLDVAEAEQESAEFEEGEGIISANIGPSSSLNRKFVVKNLYNGAGAPRPTFETSVMGRSRGEGHHMRISFNGNPFINISYDDFAVKDFTTPLSFSTLTSPTTDVSYQSVGDNLANDQQSVAYSTLTYPSRFDFDNRSFFRFNLDHNGVANFKIQNFNGGNSPIIYDLTNAIRILPTLNNQGEYEVGLPAGNDPTLTDRDLIIVNTQSTECIGDLGDYVCTECGDEKLGCFSYTTAMEATTFTDYSDPTNQGDYIIITNKVLRQGGTDYVQAYADYRASAQGRGFTPVVVDIEELYDQFAWGINTHPLSIRHFSNFMMNEWANDPAYLLLIGKSISYDAVLLSEAKLSQNLVPTYGASPSDNILTAPRAGELFPQIPIGRIPAVSPDEVNNYLQKLIEYESPKPCDVNERAWIRDVAHVSVGETAFETDNILTYLNSYSDIVSQPSYSGNVVATLSALKGIGNINSLKSYMDNGLGILTFFGHSIGDVWDVDGIGGGDPTYFDNTGKYPFVISASCFVGNIHKDSHNTMAEQYIVTADHGSIGFLATVSFGMPLALNEFCTDFYDQFTVSNYGQPMGQSIFNSIYSMPFDEVIPNGEFYNAYLLTAQQFTLSGDPAVILGGFARPEYYVDGAVNVIDPTTGNTLTGAPIIIPSNQVDFEVTVSNMGLAQSDATITINVTQSLPNGSNVLVGTINVPAPSGTSTFTIPVAVNNSDLLTPNTFTVEVNAGNTAIEDCGDNNSVSVQLQQQEVNCAALPQPSITVAQTTLCIDNGTINLTATPAGGTFSGPGVSGNTFDPAQAGDATHIISYNYTDPDTDCQLFASTQITVTAAPAPIITPSNSAICMTESVIISVPNYDQSAEYDWNFGGAEVESLGSEEYQLRWNSDGFKNIVLSTTKNGCVGGTQNITIEVDAMLDRPIISCGTSSLSSVEFTWTAVENATGYELVIDGNSITLPVGQTTYTISDLAQGITLNGSIRALGTGACGNSTFSFEQQCVSDNCPNRTLEITNIASNYCISDAAVTLQANDIGGTFTINGEATNIFNPSLLGTGTYNVSYALTTGACSYNSQVYEVTVSANPEVSIFGSNSFCVGETTELSVASGFAQYLWSDNSTGRSITVSDGGTYTVTVTNEAGCSVSASLSVTENDISEPVINSGGFNAICNGQEITLVAEGDYTDYVWNNNASNNSSLTITSPGTYSVTVTSGAGCQSSNTITIGEGSIDAPELSSPQFAVGEDIAICVGTAITLQASTQFSSYVWSTNETGSDILIDEPGTYSVTVTNDLGCVASNSIVVGSKSIEDPAITVEENRAAICEGQTTQISVPAEYSSYSWSSGASTANIVIASPGTYTVTVTDADGCRGISNVTLEATTIEAPTLFADGTASTGTITLCEGESVDLSTSDPFANYTWSDGTNTVSTDATFTINTAGTYFVEVQTPEGCTATTESIAIAFNQAATPTITASETGICASGGSVILTASDGFDSYAWSTGDTESTIEVNEAGTYTLAVTQNGCGNEASSTVVVYEDALGALAINSNVSEICVGEEVELTGIGLEAALSFDWRGEGLNSTSTETVIATPTGEATYTLSATDANGCAKTDSIVIALNLVCELPNAITPRQIDGSNDSWIIPQAYTNAGVHVQIYNRWGQKVWESTAYSNGSGWNGTNQDGNDLPHGTYYYIIDLNDGNTDPIHGAVTVLE